MADASSAYMMWRQFTGGARTQEGPKLSGYRPATIQADRQFGKTQAEALTGFVASLNDFGGAFTEVKKAKEAESNQAAEKWLQQRTIEEARAEMQAAKTGFEADPIAMAALKNRMAFNISTQVDSDVEAKIKSGTFKNQQEMDEYRTTALNAAREGFAFQMGLSDDDEAFDTGWTKGETQRRTALAGLQSDVTNKYLETQARTVKQVSHIGWMTGDVLSKMDDAQFTGMVSRMFEADKQQGLTRNPEAELQDVTNILEHLKGINGTASKMKALGEHRISVDGKLISVRDALGGSKFDLSVVEALNNQQRMDGEGISKRGAQIMNMVSTMDITGLQLARDSALQRSGGYTTDEVVQYNRGIEEATRRADMARAAAEQQAALAAEKQGRLASAMQAMYDNLSGSTFLTNASADGLGLKDEAEAVEAEQLLLAGVEDPTAKAQTAMRLALLRPTGYAAKALQSAAGKASADWNDYLTRLKNGEEANLPASVENMQRLYQSDPVGFTGAVSSRDRPYTSQFTIAATLNRDLASIARSQVAYAKLPKAEQEALTKAKNAQLAKNQYLTTGYESQALNVLTGDFLQTGIGLEQSVAKAKEAFDSQHSRVNGFPIHNSILQVNPNDPSSVEWGKSVLTSTMADRSKKFGVPVERMEVRYQADKRIVIMIDPLTGRELGRAGQADIRNTWSKAAAAREAKQPGYLSELIRQQNEKNRQNREREENSKGLGKNPFSVL